MSFAGDFVQLLRSQPSTCCLFPVRDGSHPPLSLDVKRRSSSAFTLHYEFEKHALEKFGPTILDT